ncbi:MAG: FAD-dependent oxidoreductase [Microthrixaceae bacterium]|nr:FAD-dependent oxidoreductase [Microthrixaceae bacterium]
MIGASLAGMAAVQSIRASGHDGPIVVVDPAGSLPHDRPPLTKQVLAGQWPLERAAQPAAARLDELDLDLRLGVAATGLDADRRSVSLSDGSELEASALVLATGSHARTLPTGSGHGGPGGGDGSAALPSGAFTLRTGADCVALLERLEAEPARVVVIGAGFIGGEVAATCAGRGLAVSMLEAAPVPLQRVLPGGVGGFVTELHRRNGVDVRLGVSIEALNLNGDGSVRGVALGDGSNLEAEVVVIGVGAAPTVDWLADSGLTLLEAHRGGGILCDETLLAHPGVVAAGDVAAWPNPHFGGELMRVEHWENAVDAGTHAGRRALAELGGRDASAGGDAAEATVGAFSSVPWFWSDQFDSKIQMVGRCGPDDEPVVVAGDLTGDRFVVLFRRGDLCTAALGLNRPRQVMQARMRMAESLDWDGVAALF